MEAIVSLVALLAVGYGLFRGLKWMMRSGSVQASKSPPLSPNDLKVLEESAERLMADLRQVTDECVERIQQAVGDAQARTAKFEVPAVIERDTRMTRGEAELLEGLRAISKT